MIFYLKLNLSFMLFYSFTGISARFVMQLERTHILGVTVLKIQTKCVLSKEINLLSKTCSEKKNLLLYV